MTPAEVDAIRARWAAVEAADALAPKLPLDANGHPDEAKIEAMGEEAFAEVMASFAEGANALEEASEHAEADVKALLAEVDRLRERMTHTRDNLSTALTCCVECHTETARRAVKWLGDALEGKDPYDGKR